MEREKTPEKGSEGEEEKFNIYNAIDKALENLHISIEQQTEAEKFFYGSGEEINKLAKEKLKIYVKEKILDYISQKLSKEEETKINRDEIKNIIKKLIDELIKDKEKLFNTLFEK